MLVRVMIADVIIFEKTKDKSKKTKVKKDKSKNIKVKKDKSKKRQK
jgi:hypothetical protein